MGLFSIFKSKNKIYFPGCYTKRFYEESIFQAYTKILRKVGIDSVKSEEIKCCGGVLKQAGYELKTGKLSRKNFNKLQEKGIKTIFVSCPLCYTTFKQYKETLPDWNISVEFILIPILEKLKNKPGLIKNKSSERVTYHDSCYLSRGAGIYEEPREILKMIGYELVEMKNAKEESLCCGSCGNLAFENKELADKIARLRLKQARNIGVSKVIVADVQAFKHLKENSKDIEIIEFSEVLADALGIKYTKPGE